MIEPEQLYNVNFYQKEKFYGSYKGMHYRIEKFEREMENSPEKNNTVKGTHTDANADAQTNVPTANTETQKRTETVFRVFTWPGPYNFKATPDNKKEPAYFAFSNEALREICSFLNTKWEKDYQSRNGS